MQLAELKYRIGSSILVTLADIRSLSYLYHYVPTKTRFKLQFVEVKCNAKACIYMRGLFTLFLVHS